jgi:polyhydroxyalkanoate synthesis regulator phasin
MAKKDRLVVAGEKVGWALGKANRKAHKVIQAGAVAREELEELGKQVEQLKRQLAKTTQRLKKAIR